MAKYSKSLAIKLTDALAKGQHPIAEICKLYNIAESTWHRWQAEKSEFSELIKKAQEKQRVAISSLAKRSLVKKLEGYDYEETVTEGKTDNDGKLKSKHVKRVQRHVPPSDTCIIFALKNLDPDNFSDTHRVDHTTKGQAMQYPKVEVEVVKTIKKEAESDKQ